MIVDPGRNSIARPFLATLPRDVFAGGICGLVNIATSISFSALIFSGPLTAGLPLGFSALITGSALTGLIVGLGSRLMPADGGPDTPAVAVMSVLAMSIAAAMPAGASTEQAVLHVLVALTLVTLATGLLLLALGTFKAGVWLRFIPYPVIGGFLAASGLLLVSGGLEVVLQTTHLMDLIANPSGSVRTAQLVTGLAVAGGILILRQWVRGFILLPMAFAISVGAVNLGVLAAGGLNPGGDFSGWFLQGQPQTQLWVPLSAIATAEIDWLILGGRGIEMIAVCIITAVALLLDVSTLEIARGKATDLDHELRVNGIANVISAPLGGVAGNLSMVGSLLMTEAGGVSRLASIAGAAVCALGLVFGPVLLGIIPTAVLGGVLIYLGVMVVYKALFEAAGRSTLVENVLAVAIAATIVGFGYVIGLVLGIIGACLTFALSYSQISIVRQHLTRASFRSPMDRSPDQMRLLTKHGRAIEMLWLRGYIFFGTSNSLFEFVRTNAWGTGRDERVRSVILDFQQVQGFDSSAVFSLVKLRNDAREHGVTLVLSGLSGPIRRALDGAGLFSEDEAGTIMAFDHRDEALVWCEDDLLRALGAGAAADGGFETWFAGLLGSKVHAARVTKYLKRLEIAPGESVVRQGEKSDSIDVIASGKVVITYLDETGRSIRLKQMLGQTVVGEMGFFRKADRAASVIAEEPTVVYRMKRRAFDAMAREHPEAAAGFQTALIRMLSDRLDFANREVAALQEPVKTG